MIKVIKEFQHLTTDQSTKKVGEIIRGLTKSREDYLITLGLVKRVRTEKKEVKPKRGKKEQ